ncbi:MAG: hypothetical protein HC834_05500 [Rhodospirillales bacterium]|nr:hypothetical protein [Rhodospirillales bacterium]
MTSNKLRRWVTWSMVAVLVLSLAAWYATRERLPAVVRLATGAEGGQYHEFGLLLKQTLEARTDTRVDLVTDGGTLAEPAAPAGWCGRFHHRPGRCL